MIKRARTIRPAHVVSGLIVSALLLAIMLLSRGDSKDTATSGPVTTSESSSSGVTAQPDPPDLAEQKRFVNRVAVKFIAAYYYRDGELTDKSYADKVSRFATDYFIEHSLPTLNTVLDEKVRELGAVVTAKAKVISGEGEEARSYVDVRVFIVPSWDEDLSETVPFVVSLEIIEEDGRYLVNQLAE